MERRFRISPATLRNELENNDVYRMWVTHDNMTKWQHAVLEIVTKHRARRGPWTLKPSPKAKVNKRVYWTETCDIPRLPFELECLENVVFFIFCGFLQFLWFKYITGESWSWSYWTSFCRAWWKKSTCGSWQRNISRGQFPLVPLPVNSFKKNHAWHLENGKWFNKPLLNFVQWFTIIKMKRQTLNIVYYNGKIDLLYPSFVKEVTDKILIEYDGKLPSKIDKDILVNAIPTEENFLIRIGHKIRSSGF